MAIKLILGDALTELGKLPADSVHCCVTSPPYFGLRMYLPEGHASKPHEIGLEATPAELVAVLVEVFREVRRVLRKDGTLWLNLGDSYAGSWGNQGRKEERGTQRPVNGPMMQNLKPYPDKQTNTGKIAEGSGLKPKDLIGIPWRVAFALQADGWYLRQDIIWSKPNPMPESVTDRCTKAHEYLFLLSKSARYHYDAEAIAEASLYPGDDRAARPDAVETLRPGHGGTRAASSKPTGDTRNRRSVWTVATQPFSAAHFATFPPALIEPCILAGCPKDCCATCGAPVVRQTESTFTPSGPPRKNITGQDFMQGWEGSPRGTTAKETTGWLPSCNCDEVACVVCGLVVDHPHEDRTTSTKHFVSDMREDVSPVEETGRLLQQALLRDTAEHDPAQGLSSVRENISGRRDASKVLQQVLFDEMVGDTSEGIQGRPNLDEPGLRPDLESGPSASPSLGLHDGTSTHDGKEDGPIIDADRSRPSHQRKEDGQHSGQSRAAGKARTRQQKETDLSRDLSEVHAHLPGERSCSRCGGRLIRQQASTQPGTVLDCFGGAGTTGLVADRLQRDAILIELNGDYMKLAGERIVDDGPLFAKVVVVDDPVTPA